MSPLLRSGHFSKESQKAKVDELSACVILRRAMPTVRAHLKFDLENIGAHENDSDLEH